MQTLRIIWAYKAMIEPGIYIGTDLELVCTEGYLIAFRRNRGANFLESRLLKRTDNMVSCIASVNPALRKYNNFGHLGAGVPLSYMMIRSALPAKYSNKGKSYAMTGRQSIKPSPTRKSGPILDHRPTFP